MPYCDKYPNCPENGCFYQRCPKKEPEQRLKNILINSKNPIRIVEVDKLQDRDLLELCRHRFDEIKDPYLYEIFRRFETYMRVQAIFYKLQKRDT